jgi:mRNA interferase RelE/StbE
MPLKFRKQASKSLQKINAEDTRKIKVQLKYLLGAIEKKGIIPFTEQDIKKMRGEWNGFYRLRIGKIRIIFRVNFEVKELDVYIIGFRGDVYK